MEQIESVRRVCVKIGQGLAVGAVLLISASCQDPLRKKSEEIATRNEREYGYRGEITGRVTLDHGEPAVGFAVHARFFWHQTGAPGEGWAVTDSGGYYRLHGLNPQQFIVQVDNRGKPYLVPPHKVVNLKNKAEHVDFQLRLGGLLKIKVVDAQTGEPVQGLVVRWGPLGMMQATPLGNTDRNGEFELRACESEIGIQLENPNPEERTWGAAPGYSLFHRFESKDPKDFSWVTKVYRNPDDNPQMTYRGKVVSPDGKPVAGAEVQIGKDLDKKILQSNRRGEFTFEGNRIPFQTKGALEIRASKGNLKCLYLPSTEETWGTIIVRLGAAQNASIAGRVVGAENEPVAGLPILYWEHVRESTDNTSSQPQSGGVTDKDGRFRINGLTEQASYGLRIGGQGQSEYGFHSFGVVQVPDARTLQDWIRVEPGKVKDVGTIRVLSADAEITGTVKDPQGKPITKDLAIRIKGEQTDSYGDLDAEGHFVARGIVNEPLVLKVFYGKDGFFRTGDDSPDLATMVRLKKGQRTVKIVIPRKQVN